MHSKLRSKISLLSDDYDNESTISNNDNNNNNNTKSPLLSTSITEAYAGRPSSAPSSKVDQKIIHWRSKNIENDSDSGSSGVKGRATHSARQSNHHLRLPGIQKVNRDVSGGSGRGRPKSGYI